MQFVLLASLWWLQEHGAARPTQVQLAAQAGTDLMITSQVVRKLESRGLLARDPDPGDSRARLLALTTAGAALLAGALADVEATDEAYFAVLGDRRADLGGTLTTLSAAPG